MFVYTFRRRHEDACHRFALRSPTDPEGAPRAQPSLRHLLRPRIETLQHGGRSGISLLHRRIFTIVRVSDDPPGDGQQAPDRVIDGDQHCDHCKTARTTRLGHQNCRGHIMHHHDTFHKTLPPPPLGTRINNTVPALKTTTVNRPVPARKKKRPSRREKKYNRPVPALKKHNHPVPSRLEKKIQPPRPASEKKYNRPVPLREKKTTAPSRLGKKKQPSRPASKNKNNRPVPPKILPRKIPSRPVPPRISPSIFCQSRAPAEMKKMGQPSIFPPSRPVEILAVHVKPWFFCGWFLYLVCMTQESKATPTAVHVRVHSARRTI